MGVIESAAGWAIQTANDPKSGYSQADRWGPNYDCSSFVIQAFEQAGVPLREAGASYTGNMRGAMIACGFVDVTYEIGLDSGYGLQMSDVLLNYASHTCLYIGGGKVANCRSDDGHPESGDQSGNEIRIQNYWNWSPGGWNCVLRYKGTHIGSNVSGSNTDGGSATAPRSTLSKGMRGDDVRDLQNMLQDAGYSVGKAGADGVFGNDTFRAVASFQEDHNLQVTGIADPATIRKIDAIAYPSHFDDGEDPKDGNGTVRLPDIQNGSRGDAVIVLQAALNLLGYPCGKADGICGPMTVAALNRFKETRLLPATGSADAALWEELLTELLKGVRK